MESGLCGFCDRDDGIFYADVVAKRDHRTTTPRLGRLFQPDLGDQPIIGRRRIVIRGRHRIQQRKP